VICETEKSRFDDVEATGQFANEDTEGAVSEVANLLAHNVDAKLILAASLSGDTGRVVSRYRPEVPIFVAVAENRVRQQLNLSWGVMPFVLPKCSTVEELVDRSVGYLKKMKFVKSGNRIIIIAGEPVGVSGGVNLVEIRELKD
jgi:pyruvate kinase